MGRICYLCGKREIKGEKTVAMHKFPKDAALLSAWYKFCGLSEGVDIVTGSVVVCGRHFESADYVKPHANLFGGRLLLRPGAVPSILKPVRSAPVNDSISKEDILPLTIVDHATSCTFNVDIESECNVKRRYAKPRFISEIELADLATPKQARQVLALIRKTDEKKSKKIRKLQFENRYLRKRLDTLKESVVQLRRKELTAEEAADTSMTMSEMLPVEVVDIKEEIIKGEVIITETCLIKKESDEDEESCVLVSDYICDVCGNQYSIKQYFEAHKKLCNREFDKNNADSNETCLIKKESDEDEESCVVLSDYICNVCGKQYSIKQYFEAHKKLCNREFDENNADSISDDKSFFKDEEYCNGLIGSSI